METTTITVFMYPFPSKGDMYSLTQLRRGIQNPTLFFRECNRLYHRRLYRRSYNTDGVDIFAEDWDSLLILDACRYDMFANHATLPGTLEHRISRGSSTTEFLLANFDGRDLLDTVYVTANPQLYRNRDRIDAQFHQVINVWSETDWDAETGTVRPETMTEYALEAAHKYPNKRILAHYVQPHYPFLGAETDFDKDHLDNPGDAGLNLWNRLMTGDLSIGRAEVWELYTDNLTRALPHVEQYLNEIDGKTVVTADHGNMVGERSFPIPVREWGHPRATYTEHLVKVPWHVHESGERREIVAEEPTGERESVASEVVSDRLEQLGYA